MNNKNIIVLHGLYMPDLIMQYVVRKLKRKGFVVYSFGYNSLDFNSASSKLNDFISMNNLSNDDDVYFVGHSLGGLVIRDYFNRYKPKFNDTCIVTAGTPHSGATVARFLKKYRKSILMGKSVEALCSGIKENNSEVDIGCIIGTYNVGVGKIINLKDGDGTVSLDDAELKGAKDSIRLNLNHTALVYSEDVVEQCVFFIENRKFNKV